MKEVIMQVQSFSADYPKAPIYVGELVRCKDCIHYEGDESVCRIDEMWRCRLSGVRGTNADDFCSWGKRKEE